MEKDAPWLTGVVNSSNEEQDVERAMVVALIDCCVGDTSSNFCLNGQ